MRPSICRVCDLSMVRRKCGWTTWLRVSQAFLSALGMLGAGAQQNQFEPSWITGSNRKLRSESKEYGFVRFESFRSVGLHSVFILCVRELSAMFLEVDGCSGTTWTKKPNFTELQGGGGPVW